MSKAPPRPSLWVVRHGATPWSEAGKHTGRTDVPLTEEGRAQARAVGVLLEGRAFALVLTSPLGRARETCRLAGFGARAEPCDDLLERDYGTLEGLTTAEIRERVPGWSVWTHEVPGGETLAQLAARADRVIRRAQEAAGDVLVFAHAHVLRVLAARWCALDPVEARRFPLDTGAVCELGFERETPGIRRWNLRA